MDKIHEPNATFPMDQLVLTAPTFVNSGNYFIKYVLQDSPLYIQPPKCTTKQGFMKGGKKFFCDFLFTNEHESFIRWMEDLENYSQKYIYQHRAKWFESDLEMHDIENSFTSPLKLYKSGKFYIVRTTIPTRLGKCTLKVFDEGEMDVPIESIKDSTNVITIWEIQGIKCSARSFQIEIEVKQMMVLKPNNLFESCIIRSSAFALDNVRTQEENQPTSKDIVRTTLIPESEAIEEDPVLTVDGLLVEEEEEEPTPEELPQEEDVIQIPVQEGIDDILEIDFDLAEIQEEESPVLLKRRHDVYYEMYTEAKKKAEEARDLAISAFLEAKRIKDLYMIQDPDLDQEPLVP